MLTEDKSVDECWAAIKKVLLSAQDKFVPKCRFVKGHKQKHAFSSCQTLLDKIRQKRRAHKHYKKFKTLDNYNAYAKARNQVKWEMRKAVKNKEAKIAKEIKTNPKVFYQYVSSRTKPRRQ